MPMPCANALCQFPPLCHCLVPMPNESTPSLCHTMQLCKYQEQSQLLYVCLVLMPCVHALRQCLVSMPCANAQCQCPMPPIAPCSCASTRSSRSCWMCGWSPSWGLWQAYCVSRPWPCTQQQQQGHHHRQPEYRQQVQKGQQNARAAGKPRCVCLPWRACSTCWSPCGATRQW